MELCTSHVCTCSADGCRVKRLADNQQGLGILDVPWIAFDFVVSGDTAMGSADGLGSGNVFLGKDP
jgi:hypothetical protein